jgi:hypothetical protein
VRFHEFPVQVVTPHLPDAPYPEVVDVVAIQIEMVGNGFVATMSDIGQMFPASGVKGAAGFSNVDCVAGSATDGINDVGAFTGEGSGDSVGASGGL